MCAATLSLMLSCTRETLPVSSDLQIMDEQRLSVFGGDISINIPQGALLLDDRSWLNCDNHSVNYPSNPLFTERRDTLSYYCGMTLYKHPFVQDGVGSVLSTDRLVVNADGQCCFSVLYDGRWSLGLRCEGVLARIRPGYGEGGCEVSITFDGVPVNPGEASLCFIAEDLEPHNDGLIMIPVFFGREAISLVPGNCRLSLEGFGVITDMDCADSWVSLQNEALVFDENPGYEVRRTSVLLYKDSGPEVLSLCQAGRIPAMDSPVSGLFPADGDAVPAVSAVYPYNVRMEPLDDNSTKYAFFRPGDEDVVSVSAKIPDTVSPGDIIEKVIVKMPEAFPRSYRMQVIFRKENTVWLAETLSEGRYGSVFIFEIM